MTTASIEPPAAVLKDGEKSHTLALSRGAIILMRALLSGSGWAKKDAHVRRGNKLRRMLPKIPVPKNIDDAEDWENEPHDPIVLSESERKLGAQCIGAYVAEGKLGSTDVTDCLCTEFGVVTE